MLAQVVQIKILGSQKMNVRWRIKQEQDRKKNIYTVHTTHESSLTWKYNDSESTLANHFIKYNDYESTLATHFKNNEYESTLVTHVQKCSRVHPRPTSPRLRVVVIRRVNVWANTGSLNRLSPKMLIYYPSKYADKYTVLSVGQPTLFFLSYLYLLARHEIAFQSVLPVSYVLV